MGAVGFWARLPLPVAELGIHLDPRSPQYLDSLLRTLDAGLRMGLVLGLSRLRGSPSLQAVCRDLVPLLVHPSLGKRAQAVVVLESAAPGTTGWNPSARLSELASLVESLEGGRRSKPPSVREALERLASVRNDEKHWALTVDRIDELRKPLETAVLALLHHSELVRGHLLALKSVRRVRAGEVECEAWSLLGARRSVLQTSQPLRYPDDGRLVEGRVYWRTDERSALLGLTPLAIARGEQVYLLDSIEKRSVIRRRPLDQEAMDLEDGAELDLALPGWRNAHARAAPEDGTPAATARQSPLLPEVEEPRADAWSVAGTEEPRSAGRSERPEIPRPQLPLAWIAAATSLVVLLGLVVAGGWWWLSSDAPTTTSEQTRNVLARRACPTGWTLVGLVSVPVCIQTYEATWRDVRACPECEADREQLCHADLGGREALCTRADDEPANCVCPALAERVCRALGHRDLGVDTGRLPTAAEWKSATQWPDLTAPATVVSLASRGGINLCDSAFLAGPFKRANPRDRGCVAPSSQDRAEPGAPTSLFSDGAERVVHGGRFPGDRVNGLFDVYGNLSELVRLENRERWGAAGRSFLSSIGTESGALIVGPGSRRPPGGLPAHDLGAQYGFRCLVPLEP